MRFRHLFIVVIVLFILVIGSQAIFAQEDGQTCSQFAQRVVNDLWMNCADPEDESLKDNSVCYGYQTLDALFEEDQGELSEPGNWAELTWLDRLHGTPFNLEEDEWGLGLFHVQAYVDGVGDQIELTQVRYLTLGDVEIEQADSPVFDANNELIIDADHLAPMQRFYLRHGWDEPGCQEIPDPMVLIQNPREDEKAVRITANSAEIELESTILLMNLQPMFDLDQMAARTMRLITLNGMATFDPDGARLLVPPGYYVDFCLSDPQDLGLDGEENDQVISCAPTDPLPLTELDLAEFMLFEQIPDNILDRIDIPGIGRRSGFGRPDFFFIFEDPGVLEAAREACSLGLLPEQICRTLLLTYVSDTCPQYTDRVVRVDAWGNCADLANDPAFADNSVCYGYRSLEALFEEGQGTLASPGDFAELTWLNRLSGTPLNRETDEWGIGLLHVHAYVDDEVGLTRVKYVVFGDVEIEPADPPTFDDDGQLIIDADHLAPMQHVFLRNGWAQSECEEFDPSPVLLVQSPSDLDKPVRIMVNSLEIELESTVLLKNVQPMLNDNNMAAQTMRVITLNGTATVDPDGARVSVPQGYFVDVCLGAPENLGLDGLPNDQEVSCEPSEPQPLTALDLADLAVLDHIPSTIIDSVGMLGLE